MLDLLGRFVDSIPEGGGVQLIDEIRLTPAGTAAASAMVAAKMGLHARLIGAIGNDEIGRVLRNGLESRGVDTSLLQELDGVRTSATILPIRRDGERPALHAPGASLAVRVDEVTDEIVKGDFNHPLAGERLTFDIKVVTVREATEEELAALEACGPTACGSGGCSSCG